MYRRDLPFLSSPLYETTCFLLSLKWPPSSSIFLYVCCSRKFLLALVGRRCSWDDLHTCWDYILLGTLIFDTSSSCYDEAAFLSWISIIIQGSWIFKKMKINSTRDKNESERWLYIRISNAISIYLFPDADLQRMWLVSPPHVLFAVPRNLHTNLMLEALVYWEHSSVRCYFTISKDRKEQKTGTGCQIRARG